ncbi:hypothetical protein pb186bvf_018463 [Paramecium bursaria]
MADDIDFLDKAFAIANKKDKTIMDNFFDKQPKSQKDVEFKLQNVNVKIYNPLIPNYLMVQYESKQVSIEIEDSYSYDNFLLGSLSSQKQAIKDRIIKFNELLEQNANEQEGEKLIVGRLIKYVNGDKIFENGQLYFDSQFRENGLPKQIIFAINKYFIYPGQIIGAVFDSSNSQSLEIKQIETNFNFNDTNLCLEKDDEIEFSRSDATSIILFAGPFTFDSFRYTPLMNLLNIIENKKVPCDILLLLGPLVDVKNPAFQNLEIEIEELKQNIIKLIYAKLPKVQVLIVNSTKEAQSLYPLPQPPLQFEIQDDNKQKFKGLRNQFKFLGNPCRFILDNGPLIGIINSDIVNDLRQQVWSKGNRPMDHLQQILEQFLQQKTFVPVYPISDPIDLTKINEQLSFDAVPDIMITPSENDPFSIVVQNTLFINPGYNKYALITYFGNNQQVPYYTTRVDNYQL